MVRLYCFGESGNAYKVALMLTLCEIEWEPVHVDFFNGETRTERYRTEVNELGEAPVLEWHGEKLTQSGIILTRLARKTGRFRSGDSSECWRWILFDNHKFTSAMATFRALRSFAPNAADPAVLAFLHSRVNSAYAIAEKHLTKQDFVLGDRPTIADLSMAGYIYYPAEETGIDLPADYPALDRWRTRISALPGWRGPYDLMTHAFPPAPK